jgi:hypothetical protein
MVAVRWVASEVVGTSLSERCWTSDGQEVAEVEHSVREGQGMVVVMVRSLVIR